jgi:hypothetical protein
MSKLNRIQMVLIGILLFIVLTACGLMDLYSEISGDEQESVEEKVQATLTAIASEKGVDPTQAPSPTEALPTVTQTTQATLASSGFIKGSLSYPSEFLPPQRVVAFDVNDFDIYYLTEVQSGSSYQLEVLPGYYYVLAYLINPSQLGAGPDFFAAYSQTVLCGLQAGCDDHSLVPVEVQPGETMMNIDPIDWYLPPGVDAGWPSDPLKAETGSISGDLGYPSEYIPPMRVVAFDINSTGYYYVDTLRNQGSYQIDGLPAGTYHVLAFIREEGPDISSGYSQFVICGMTVDCNDHSLVDVIVYPGETTENVDPVDFYAQPGEADWPEDPTQ